MNLAQIGHLCNLAELLRRDVSDVGIDRHHRVVDPNVDRPKFELDLICRAHQSIRVADIGLDRERFATGRLDFLFRALQTLAAARNDGHLPAALPEPDRDGAPDPCARAGDHGSLE